MPTTEHIPKKHNCMTSIVAPAGVLAAMDMRIPSSEHITASMAEHIVTALKLLKSLIAGNATDGYHRDRGVAFYSRIFFRPQKHDGAEDSDRQYERNRVRDLQHGRYRQSAERQLS